MHDAACYLPLGGGATGYTGSCTPTFSVHTPERLRGEVLTTRRYINLHLPFNTFTFTFTDAQSFGQSYTVHTTQIDDVFNNILHD